MLISSIQGERKTEVHPRELSTVPELKLIVTVISHYLHLWVFTSSDDKEKQEKVNYATSLSSPFVDAMLTKGYTKLTRIKDTGGLRGTNYAWEPIFSSNNSTYDK